MSKPPQPGTPGTADHVTKNPVPELELSDTNLKMVTQFVLFFFNVEKHIKGEPSQSEKKCTGIIHA